MTRTMRAHTALMPTLSFVLQSCWVFAWFSLLEQAAVARVAVGPVIVALFLAATAWRTYLPRIIQRRWLAEVLFWAVLPLAAALAGKFILFGDMPWSDTSWFFALPRAVLYVLFETRAAELLLFFGSGLAWFLGRRLASQPISYSRLLGDFQFGLIMLLSAFLVGHGLGQGLHRPILLSLAFFGSSLSGMAIARGVIETNSKTSLSRGHFTGTILTLVGIVSVLGLLIGMALTPDVLRVLLDAVRYVGHLFAEFMKWLASFIPEPDIDPTAPAESATGDDSALREFYRSLPFPALLRRGLRIAWIIMVLGMLVAALWQLCAQVLAWLRRRMDIGEDAELESLDMGFLSELAAFLRHIAARLRAMAVRMLNAVLRIGRQDKPDTVRAVYVRFVKWANKKVLPREPWQSPREYMTSLAEFLPTASPDLATVTEAYVLARYGRHNPTSDVVDDIAEACKRIRKTSRRVKKHDSAPPHKEGDEA
ncbi:MAG: DUF4129 domain-containing protein [Dehalococcoidia bacterium]|nr:DUF4129 domain-containing protein [Dehalococcoidia bacterium]